MKLQGFFSLFLENGCELKKYIYNSNASENRPWTRHPSWRPNLNTIKYVPSLPLPPLPPLKPPHSVNISPNDSFIFVDLYFRLGKTKKKSMLMWVWSVNPPMLYLPITSKYIYILIYCLCTYFYPNVLWHIVYVSSSYFKRCWCTTSMNTFEFFKGKTALQKSRKLERLLETFLWLRWVLR